MFTRNFKCAISLFLCIFIQPIKSQTLSGATIFEIIDKVPQKRGWIIYRSQKIMKEQRIIGLSNCPLWTAPDCDTLYVIHYADDFLSGIRVEQILTSKYMYELYYDNTQLQKLSVYSYPDCLDEFWDVVLNWKTNVFTDWNNTTGHDLLRIEAMRLIRVKSKKYKYSIYDFYDNSNSLGFRWNQVYVQNFKNGLRDTPPAHP